MSKQIVVKDQIHKMLNEIVEARMIKAPYLTINKQSVASELILLAYKREVKK